jgi:hypothetical protein
MRHAFLSISPAPAGLFAVFRQGDGSFLLDAVVTLSIVTEIEHTEGDAHFHVKDKLTAFVSGLISGELGFDVPEESSNFCGYVTEFDCTDQDSLKAKFGEHE